MNGGNLKLKMTIEGGMKKNFISQIAKSEDVNTAVYGTFRRVKDSLEAKAKSADPNGNMPEHYGSRRYSGKWGSTWVIWARSELARKNLWWFDIALAKVKNVYKRSR